tara:strand:+ start:812 stop:1069 length:258 start_codon:yes stop_codon:yes gene_type:complete
MFDLLFDTPAYKPVYVISDSEMKELQRVQNQEELNELINQKKRLGESYKAQVKYIEEREKELKNELKSIDTTKKKSLSFFKFLNL